MRRKDPNEDIIRKLMGKPPRKKGGVRRNPNYKGPISKDSEKMSFREKIRRLIVAGGRPRGGAIIAKSNRDTSKPFFLSDKRMGTKKKPAVVKPKKKPAVVKPKKK